MGKIEGLCVIESQKIVYVERKNPKKISAKK